ncbi:MAG: hypothetical protein AAF205_00050 [Pseudomonadota bacterium]
MDKKAAGGKPKPKGMKTAAAISQGRSGCPPGTVMRGGKCYNSRTGNLHVNKGGGKKRRTSIV